MISFWIKKIKLKWSHFRQKKNNLRVNPFGSYLKLIRSFVELYVQFDYINFLNELKINLARTKLCFKLTSH